MVFGVCFVWVESVLAKLITSWDFSSCETCFLVAVGLKKKKKHIVHLVFVSSYITKHRISLSVQLSWGKSCSASYPVNLA